VRFEISFSGHENIRSLHQKTIEITRDPDLSTRGDCIVGVRASSGCAGIPDRLKERLRDPGSTVRFRIEVAGRAFSFEGRGHPSLELSHPHDIVIRKSGFVCPRTAAVGADAASDSLPREIVRRLQDPDAVGSLTIEVP